MSVLNFFHFALKNRVCREIHHCIEYIFTIQDFWETCACSEKQSFPWIHCIEYIFFITQDFWAICACPEKQFALKIFHCIEIFFIIHDFWATCTFPENSLSWIHCIEYIFLSFRIFEQFALALKIFTVLKYFLSFRIFEQLALALKNRVSSEIFHCIEYIFYIIPDFWATCACAEKQLP